MTDKINQYFTKLIKSQIKEHGIVIWYDPEGFYKSIYKALSLDDIPIYSYTGSFLKLRHEIENLMSCQEKPGMLIYIPIDRHKTENAMIEAEVAGCYMTPGHAQKELNTRLEHVAYQMLMPTYKKDIDSILKKIQSGEYNLEDINRIASSAYSHSTGTLKLVYDKSDPIDLLIGFLSQKDSDPKIITKNGINDIRSLIKFLLDIEIPAQMDLEQIRNEVFSIMLINEFIITSQIEKIPESILQIPRIESDGLQKNVLRCLTAFRELTPLRSIYMDYANQVELKFQLRNSKFDVKNLINVHSFAVFEQMILESAYYLILDDKIDELQHIISQRQGGFWAEIPPFNLQWFWLQTALNLMQQSQMVLSQLKAKSWTLPDFIRTYTKDWYQLDILFRSSENRYLTLEADFIDTSDILEKAQVKVRQIYTSSLWAMAESLQTVIKEQGYISKNLLYQKQIFSNIVKPEIGKTSKIGYILVDAFRYDMAMSLLDALKSAAEVSIEPAIGQLPAITQIGMAALMPDADKKLALAEKTKTVIGLSVKDKTLFTRNDRVKYLREFVSEDIFFETKLDQIRKPKKAVRDQIDKASFIFVTSQEIDQLGEQFGPGFARHKMDDILVDLRRGVLELLKLGVEKIIVSADHGYLFGNELSAGDKIDEPGGRKVSLHRRVWIGEGGMNHESYLRFSEKDFGLDGELEMVFPKNISAFKSPGGNESYFHGGLSLQELIIPVLKITTKDRPKTAEPRSTYTLEMDKENITNRFFTVRVLYESSDMFAEETKRVQISIQSDKEIVGRVVTAEYGFESDSGDILLENKRPNVLTVLLDKEPLPDKIDILVHDPQSVTVLAKLKDIKVQLMI